MQGSKPNKHDEELAEVQSYFSKARWVCLAMLGVGILLLAGNKFFNSGEVGLLFFAGGALTIIGAIAGAVFFGSCLESKNTNAKYTYH
jgi:hypothetical protein